MIREFIIDEGELAALVPDRNARRALEERLVEVRKGPEYRERYGQDRRPQRQWRELMPEPDEKWIDLDAETPDGWVGLAMYDCDGRGGGQRLIRKVKP